MNPDLAQFLEHARAKGLDYATIRSLLLAAGWKDKQISEAIAAEALDVPVPEPKGVTSARDTFLHLLSFTALYTWVISLITLLFTCINVTWADPAWPEYRFSREAVDSAIRWSLAAIVVAYPLFLLLWRHLLRAMERDPERGRGRLRRWLIYFSLFLGAVTVLADVITLVYFAFEGELTVRFLLKAGVLFAIAGGVFLYMALNLRGRKEVAS
jgi:hypothetical protein